MLNPTLKQKTIDKVLTNLTSTKYHVLIISSIFFKLGTLSESGWITVVLGTLGYHTANELGTIFKGNPNTKASKK